MKPIKMVTIEKIHTLRGHNDSIYALAAGLRPEQFYSAGGDGNIVAWDLQNLESGRVIAKVPASVYAMRLMPGRNVLIVGQNYDGIHLIDLDQKKEVASLQLTKTAIFDIQVSGDHIFVATGEGVLFVINKKTLQVDHQVQVSENNLRKILITKDQRCVVAASDGMIRQYEMNGFQLINEVQAHEKSVFGLFEKPEDNLLLSIGRDARLKFWQSPTLEADESINAHMYAINDLVFRKDGHYMATASMDKTIKVWNYQKRKLIKVIDKARHQGHISSVNKLLWLDVDNLLISASDDRSIGVWRIFIAE